MWRYFLVALITIAGCQDFQKYTGGSSEQRTTVSKSEASEVEAKQDDLVVYVNMTERIIFIKTGAATTQASFPAIEQTEKVTLTQNQSAEIYGDNIDAKTDKRGGISTTNLIEKFKDGWKTGIFFFVAAGGVGFFAWKRVNLFGLSVAGVLFLIGILASLAPDILINASIVGGILCALYIVIHVRLAIQDREKEIERQYKANKQIVASVGKIKETMSPAGAEAADKIMDHVQKEEAKEVVDEIKGKR